MDINLSSVNYVIRIPGTVLAVFTMQDFDTVLVQDKRTTLCALSAPARPLPRSMLSYGKGEKALDKVTEVSLYTVNYGIFFSRTTMYARST